MKKLGELLATGQTVRLQGIFQSGMIINGEKLVTSTFRYIEITYFAAGRFRVKTSMYTEYMTKDKLQDFLDRFITKKVTKMDLKKNF